MALTRSWIDSANNPHSDFPLANLPLGVCRGAAGTPAICTAIGDQVLDLRACAEQKLLAALDLKTLSALSAPTLNLFMSLGSGAVTALRSELTRLLAADAPAESRKHLSTLLRPAREVEMLLPVDIGDYTDFYASLDHAMNVGKLFRPDNPLLPNYKWIPIGYHGRASSIIVSGQPVTRPSGQRMPPNADTPVFGPSILLDYELEVGAFISTGNALAHPIPLDHAESHIFGLCLVNDWSARDIQAWEYQPLGPFLGKNFATTISPWIVTLQALAPYRVSAVTRAAGDPAPLPYLNSAHDQQRGAFDIQLDVLIRTPRMRAENQPAAKITRSRFRDLYWTLAQMLAHHTSGGCNLRAGDLIASGTVSGPTPDARGCLLELTARGAQPLTLPNGESRKFLEDGDEVILRGFCEREGHPRIGFGECSGIIQAAPA
jgi:fumarylacetoacetase